MIAAPVAVASTAGTSHRECAPVPYVLDGQLGPPTAAQLVEDVFAEIEVMSGIRFTAAPERQRASAPVRLAWVPPSADIAWDELQLGWATAHLDRRGRFETVVSGEVLFRHPDEVEQILRGPVDWHTIARHEIGHLLGLPHQSDPGDVMHPRLTGAAQAWSASDRAHLAARGRAAGCR